ncbi:hypothetical protein BHE90_004626 [Fusarium euwallaceae]|uniref:Uncharacterized protein n=5 Tax=Fusarium solani species complex TaxID=232080 RepID=A0A3M2S638_9HYPO|nr:hypothetical protein CDV36_007357 [Fusarium kuroshium]RSL39755.1 hypothetical protein CEP53_013828 [Fusarium sp. AF-6]RSL76982.1 hypothetical protein CEP51_009473 [Fusarium floridanum]RSM14214.1 hypothetical protein CEP52_001447 [Fusarium oligoseptatum]RSM17828.1 hypothetical protein CDV31_003254 [Fusarium ambrosium]RTE80847.1 hypothetical protein BHE90_004626 [Fusarium euwallaceae]
MPAHRNRFEQPEYDAQSAESLLVLVKHLDIASGTMAAAKEPASTEQAKTLVNDIGEYLIQAAQAWAQLTDALVESRQIHQAVLDAHEQARAQNHLSDLSTVVSMDVDLSKLSKIRDLTAQFSRDVHHVWRNGSGRGGSS